ncbi:FtsX-like permease family protein [Paractinoplanes globisporus]|uniref:FtsX-like permease family protein n=1 Tax=Paractinoplanes globisporus TaxID=113565 RepID=A0ABW6WCL0_9ACTN|nr:FtsX-like permease family protein [Actinoplanes globisporus]
MIALLARRARAQWPLLASLLAVLAIGATLLGTCALLVTRTSERAVEVAASRADPADVEITAYTVGVSPGNARSVSADTHGVLASAIAPYHATISTRASSVMRSLPGDKEAYLSGVEGLASRATLVTGRWPRAAADATSAGTPLEAAVFDNTARLLGLKVGSRIRLGEEMTRDPAPPLTVTVVGLVHPLPDAGWDRDPLAGEGFDPAPSDSAFGRQVQAYGPFLVDLADLLTSGSALDRLEVGAQPDLSAPRARDLDRLTTSVLAADQRLAAKLGDRVRIERVSSALPRTLIDARGQQELTAGAVLALALIGIVLTAIALALAGRLTTGVRADESELLGTLGTSRGQFAAAATVEALALAVLATALAIPASSALHAALTRIDPLAGAGLAARPAVTVPQVVAVAGGALALAVLLVALAAWPATPSGDRRRRRELLARSGADVLLVALAGVGWWQLHAQPAASGTRADAVRVLAPALLLTAGTALALRLVPPALRRAERLSARGRGLVLPMAAFQAARRPQAVAAGLLIGLGCAAATFGTAFDATWHASQRDQADLAVGTDLAVSLGAPPVTGQSTAVAAATGGTVSPVAQRNITVGQWLGGSGASPRMVAVDTRRAPAVLRGRGDWASAASLAPAAPATGIALPPGTTPSVIGRASGKVVVGVTPWLLLQDAGGLRTTCNGPAIPFDGKPHAVPGCVTRPGLSLIGVALPISGEPWAWEAVSTVDVTLTLPGASSTQKWTARAASPESAQLTGPAVAIDGDRIRMTGTVQFADPTDLSRTLVATAFPDPGPVPIAVSARLAHDVGAHVGSKLSIAYGVTPVSAEVAEIVPAVPSAPGAPAALADVDALSRALIVRGDLESPVTAWWIGNPRAGAEARVGALHLGTVTTRGGETERLTGSPLRASLPAVLRVLVAATILLLLGGVVLHVTCDVQLRALEVARLRGLGMSRRDIRRALLGEHAAVLLPLLAAGAVVGALATWVVAPLMIRSDTGAAPVPAALAHWPWAAETLLIAALVAGAGLAVAAVVTVQARRADAAHLRVAS